jgi:hypothetical protein
MMVLISRAAVSVRINAMMKFSGESRPGRRAGGGAWS